MGVADHAEKGVGHALAVDGPVGVEDLVSAVLRVDLSKHEELDVGRVASKSISAVALARDEGIDEVIDLIVGKSKTESLVGFDETLFGNLAVGSAVSTEKVDVIERARLSFVEESVGGRRNGRNELSHAVVEQVMHLGEVGRLEAGRRGGLENENNAALDAVDMILEGAHASNVGGFARPGRDASWAGQHKENCLGRVGGITGKSALHGGTGVGEVDIVTVDKQAVEDVTLRTAGVVERSQSLLGGRVDEVNVKSVDGSELSAEFGVGPLQELSALGGVEQGRADQRQHLVW